MKNTPMLEINLETPGMDIVPEKSLQTPEKWNSLFQETGMLNLNQFLFPKDKQIYRIWKTK